MLKKKDCLARGGTRRYYLVKEKRDFNGKDGIREADMLDTKDSLGHGSEEGQTDNS